MRRLASLLSGLCLALAVPTGVLAAPPTNDLPAGATVIGPALPVSIAQDTTEATVGSDDVGCGTGGLDQATVWYAITPTANVDLFIDASQSDYGVGINLFLGGPTPETLINCFEGAGGHHLDAGLTYYLMFADVDGDATNGGQLSVTLAEAPPPIEVTLTVDPVAKVDQRTGSAVLSGTITCTPEADEAFLDITVRQRVGRYIIRAFGFTAAECGSEPTTWSAEVTGDNGRLAGGRATATILAVACDAFQCSESEHTVSLRLRR